MLEKFARCTLPAFSHPVVRDQNISVGAPDTGDEDRFGRHCNVTSGSSGDSGKPREGLALVIAGCF